MSAVSNTSHPCSNPGCTQVGNFQKCGKCESVYYHSKECQKEHWKHGHREACADLTKRKIEEVTAIASSRSAQAEDLKNKSSELRNESSELNNESSRLLDSTTENLLPTILNIAVKVGSGGFSSQREAVKQHRERVTILNNVFQNYSKFFSLEREADKKAEKADENDKKAEKASEKAEKARKRAERLKANLDTSSTVSSQSKTAGSTDIADDLDVD